jgi:PadR family transcriptional regulator, regulatory protein PadR
MLYMEPGNDANWLGQVRKGVAEQCVLALLTTGEKYGVELARELTARGPIIGSEGTLYPLLARLRRSGLVETSWQESASGPPRRYYHLTSDGQLALAMAALGGSSACSGHAAGCTARGITLPLAVAIMLAVAGLAAHVLPPIHLMRARRRQLGALA